MDRITRAGLPAATTFEGRSFVTIDPAPLDELAIPVERGRQDLDRHPATELPVEPLLDPSHPALAEQRAELQTNLRGGKPAKEILFAQPGSLTKVFAIASGKGGVGKSSVTVNLALALAKAGRTVGIVDADIYGHSVPAMLGIADSRPTQVEDMIMPVPTPSGVSVISIGMLKPRRDQVVAWRGPMLDRALTSWTQLEASDVAPLNDALRSAGKPELEYGAEATKSAP